LSDSCDLKPLPPQVNENCNLKGHHPASGGNSLPTFRDNLSVQSSRIKNPTLESRTNRLLTTRCVTAQKDELSHSCPTVCAVCRTTQTLLSHQHTSLLTTPVTAQKDELSHSCPAVCAVCSTTQTLLSHQHTSLLTTPVTAQKDELSHSCPAVCAGCSTTQTLHSHQHTSLLTIPVLYAPGRTLPTLLSQTDAVDLSSFNWTSLKLPTFLAFQSVLTICARLAEGLSPH